jgi:hypothetical protein
MFVLILYINKLLYLISLESLNFGFDYLNNDRIGNNLIKYRIIINNLL